MTFIVAIVFIGCDAFKSSIKGDNDEIEYGEYKIQHKTRKPKANWALDRMSGPKEEKNSC